MAVNPCLVHSQRWRSDFQCVLNSMQKENTFKMPAKYIRRVGRCICTCDSDDDDIAKEISEETVAGVDELKSFYDATNLSTDDKSKLGKAQPILTRLAAELSPEATGKILFLNIIRDALDGRYERLEQDKRKPSDENDPDRVQWDEEVITLPLAIDYVGHLFGIRGQRIKTIAQTYKCQIHVKNADKKHKSMNFDFGAAEISVVLRWNVADGDKIPLLKEHLQSVVKSIIVKRRRHEQALKDFAEKRRKRAINRWSQSSDARPKRYGARVDTNFKAISEKQFERHQTGRAKSSKGRNQGNETRVLDGGYCYFCNSLYWRKKGITEASCGADSDSDEQYEVADTETADAEDVPSPYADNACRYHSGYLVISANCQTKKSEKNRSHEWTCCSEVLIGLISDETKRLSHASSGCQRGRHLWRPPNRKTVTDRCVGKLRGSREAIGKDDLFVK